ncbi:hypothetical protein [Paenibacillus sinopodophylli]|uniref:hypothetical protein n=1 Tax=Paenibacillus sinopodophylli TaxID=1837342 RepID=UPI00110CA8F5|nr:hypothetical protein [Paenibacillus sinopodophylli]
MKGNFKFKTNLELEIFSLMIAQLMVDQFQISDDEAIGRISQFWEGKDLLGSIDVIYHEDCEYWANQIYYDNEPWWRVEDKTQLRVRKYPKEKK